MDKGLNGPPPNASMETSDLAGQDLNVRGDPRMNRAVQAKLDNHHISLADALRMGGFDYPPQATACTVDYDNVTLGQRKNQLNRRLRQAKLYDNTGMERRNMDEEIGGNDGDNEVDSFSSGNKRPSSAANLTQQPHIKKPALHDVVLQQQSLASPDTTPTLACLTHTIAMHNFDNTTATESFSKNALSTAVASQAPQQLLEQLWHMQSLVQVPQANIVQQELQQQKQAISAASDLLLLLAQWQQQQQKPPQPPQQLSLLDQLKNLIGQQQLVLQQHVAMAPSSVALAIPTVNAAGSNANHLDTTKRLYGAPITHDTAPQPLSESATLINAAANGNIVHSLTTSLASTLNSHRSTAEFSSIEPSHADRVGGRSDHGSILNHHPIADVALQASAELSNNSVTIQTTPIGGTATVAGTPIERRRQGEASESLFQGHEMHVETDHRLRNGLEIFERCIRQLYQHSMLQAGFSTQDSQETSQAYHNFAFHAWRRECQNLQRLLRSGDESANNDNPSAAVSFVSSVGGNSTGTCSTTDYSA